MVLLAWEADCAILLSPSSKKQRPNIRKHLKRLTLHSQWPMNEEHDVHQWEEQDEQTPISQFPGRIV